MAPPGSAGISVRDYIYYLPHPLPQGTKIPYSVHLPKENQLDLPPTPTEPTSTLVLTSPKATFVDIRMLKHVDESDLKDPNYGNSNRLEWAFAGTSKSYAIATPAALLALSNGNEADGADVGAEPLEGITHSVWSHWLDSSYPPFSDDIPADEGDMYALADGRTLEFGTGSNPNAPGTLRNYEEMWSDVEIQGCGEKSKHAIVLKTENVGARVRGVVVRLGQYCQGIMMQGSKVGGERWEFVEGQWKRTVKVGDMFLPCVAACEAGEMVEGKRVRYGEYEWVVDEVAKWE